MEYKFTDDNFEAEVIKSELPVVVDFSAVWCGPCQMMAPVLKSLAEELDGKVKVGKIDIDENPSVTMAAKITAVPTIMLFKDGQAMAAARGFMGKDELKEELGL